MMRLQKLTSRSGQCQNSASQRKTSHNMDRQEAKRNTSASMKFPTERIKNAEIQKDDIFLISYPKSGMHLLRHLILYVLNDADEDAVREDRRGLPFEVGMVEDGDDPRAVFLKKGLDNSRGIDTKTLKTPRFFITHLAFEMLPGQLHEKKPKIIYLARNPKDMLISFLNQSQKMKVLKTAPPTLQNLIDKFVADSQTSFGVEEYGSWRQHVLSRWARRDDDNVLFVKYEDLTRNLTDYIRLLARFLGKDISNDAVEKIAGLCSIESMRNDPKARSDDTCKLLGIPPEESPFVNKGRIGRWKEFFTVAQSERFDEDYRTKTSASGLEFDFE
ncbi:sulfotransferase 4A1-like [Ptychodera flava]|uniref:sulfotransferase 4A1-like n=1 Tax=Ptychodera flava TaxID=63121 RepID=UPI00396A4012